MLADLLTILGLSGLVFFLSQFLQLVQDRDPLEAGLAELPAAVGAVTAGLLAGQAARRWSVRSVVAERARGDRRRPRRAGLAPGGTPPIRCWAWCCWSSASVRASPSPSRPM
ncbi:hypothetical protein GCM10020000_65830 [Streptomyces olivoverticillatus]